jgi:hypothetical protein
MVVWSSIVGSCLDVCTFVGGFWGLVKFFAGKSSGVSQPQWFVRVIAQVVLHAQESWCLGDFNDTGLEYFQTTVSETATADEELV